MYNFRSQVKAQPSSGHIFHARSCVRRDYPSGVMEIYLTVLKVVACLACWCRGKTFPSPSISDVWRHWWHSNPRYHMSRRTFFLTCTWVCVHLDGSTCSESFPEGTCHVEPPEQVPRTSARAQTCARGLGGLPVCHGVESTRKDPRPEEKKMPRWAKKTHLYIVIYFKYNIVSRQ